MADDEIARMRARRRVERMAATTQAACPHAVLLFRSGEGPAVGCKGCCRVFTPEEAERLVEAGSRLRVIA